MFFWLILIFIIGIMFFIKKDSRPYLLTGFYIFIGGAIFRLIGLNEVSENLMRISLLFWVIGLFKAFQEFN